MPDSRTPEVIALFETARDLCHGYINAITFLALDSARNPAYQSNNLLVLAIEDHLEASVGLPEMASLGLVNTCRRELRFLLEASIKLCYVEQSLPGASIDEKLDTLSRQLDSPNIGLRKSLRLHLLPDIEREAFSVHVGRLYGETSRYVHLTLSQVRERDELIRLGAKPLTPSDELLKSLLSLLSSVLAASYVYVAHAMPSFAVGDFLVREDGTSADWPLANNRWIAYLDEHFDYKHERKANLSQIKHSRWSRVDA